MISKQIKKFRERKNWSQRKLAEEAGIGYTVVTKLEQGVAKEPTIQTIIKLADALETSIDELVGRKKGYLKNERNGRD